MVATDRVSDTRSLPTRKIEKLSPADVAAIKARCFMLSVVTDRPSLRVANSDA